MKPYFLLVALMFSLVAAGQNFKLGDLKKLKDITAPQLTETLKSSVKDKLAEPAEDYDQESFNYAISFSDNAGVFEAREKYDKHKTVLNKVINSEEELPPLEKAAELNKTGEILYASNQFNAARLVFAEALLIYQSEEATDGEPFALLQSNRGLLFHAIGQYSRALELTDQALAIRESIFNQRAPHGVSLNNKAVLLKDLGKYNESEKMMEQAYAIIAKVKGKESKDAAIVLNNQAMLFHALGRYQEAEDFMLQSLKIAKGQMSEKKANYIKLRINLAILYKDMERYNESEEIYQDAIQIKKKRLGTFHPDYAHLQRGLASLYLAMGKTDKVPDLLESAANTYKRRFNDEHPAYASTLRELGNFERSQNHLDKAETLLKEVKSIRSRIYGSEHPESIDVLEDLALLDWQKGKVASASQRYKTVIDHTLSYIDSYFGPMSEREKMRYWDKLRPRVFRYYSFVSANHSVDPSLPKMMFETNLLVKGLLLSSTNKMRESILNGKDEELKNTFKKWIDKRENLAHAYTYTKEELEEEKIDIAQMEQEVNTLEKELSEKSNVFKAGYLAREQSKMNVVSKALSPGEVLIDVVEFPFYQIPASDESRYVYFVVHPNTTSPKVILAKKGKDMDGKYLKYYRNAIKFKISDENSYSAYWAPLAAVVKDAKRVYVSSDGVYNQINLNTLRDPSGTFLIKKHQFTLIGNARELPEIKARGTKIRIASADLYGAPDFGSGLSDAQRRGSSVSNLPGTKKEVETISKTLKSKGINVSTNLGEQATEENIKKSNPTVLHIATHGFFLEDTKKAQGDLLFGVEVSKASQSPLHRSGLLLAGAQKTVEESSIDHTTQDNGVLTAYEVMNMDLSNNELVILSACETGLGDVKVGEGVYGLQRALQIAGSKSIIMSLWKVSDESTASLMTSFYKNLTLYKDKQKAFKLAQEHLMSQNPEPYHWGAFVLIGS